MTNETVQMETQRHDAETFTEMTGPNRDVVEDRTSTENRKKHNSRRRQAKGMKLLQYANKETHFLAPYQMRYETKSFTSNSNSPRARPNYDKFRPQ